MIGGKNKQTKFGFTLTELIVAVAIFALVITGAITLLTTVLRAQRKSAAIQGVQDNARYLIGFMAKEIRMSEFRSLNGTTQVLEIIHPIKGDISYEFIGEDIMRDPDGDGSESPEQINSDEVEVDGGFYIDGKAVGGDNEQPRVTIVMKVGTTGIRIEERAEINLQTTLSQRNLD